jgi:type II restriction enzyme
MDNSLITHLNNLNPDWTSSSRIFGAAVELWVVSELKCDCGGSYEDFPANKKGVDVRCKSCANLVQVKCSKRSFKPDRHGVLKIMGAEYQTTLATITDSPFDLLLVQYNFAEKNVKDVKIVRSKFINAESVEPRRPLSGNARRAGWQGCHLVFHADQIETVCL